MIFRRKDCSLSGRRGRTLGDLLPGGSSAVFTGFFAFRPGPVSGIFFLFFLSAVVLPASQRDRGLIHIDFGSEGGERSGYLATRGGGQLSFAARPDPVPEESGSAAASVDGSAEKPTLRGFLERMEAESGPKEGASGGANRGANSGAEVGFVEGPETNPPTVETIAATPRYVDYQQPFPRPQRDTQNFEDIYLFFPIEDGEIKRLGLVQGVHNSSRFRPPEGPPAGSQAVLQRIDR